MATVNGMPSDVMTEAEAAEYLRRPPGTLRQWRFRSQGPPYVKEHNLVRYLRRDLDDWLAANRVVPQRTAAS